MTESIVGPLSGLFVAAFACPVDRREDQYLGSFRVYPFRPDSYADRGHLLSEVSKPRYPSAEVALHHAQLKGAAAAERLAQLETR